MDTKQESLVRMAELWQRFLAAPSSAQGLAMLADIDRAQCAAEKAKCSPEELRVAMPFPQEGSGAMNARLYDDGFDVILDRQKGAKP